MRERCDKEYYRAWVNLYNPDLGNKGSQGRLLVSVTVLEPGDEIPRRPGVAVPEDGSAAMFKLSIDVLRGEAIPAVEKSVLGKISSDPFVSVAWGNDSTHTLQLKSLCPEWYEHLHLRVLKETSPNGPPQSDQVLVRVREHNSLSSNTDIATGSMFLSDILDGKWAEPCWLNLYGGPRLQDSALSASELAGDAHLDMNCGKVPGVAFRGRILLRATMLRKMSDKWHKSKPGSNRLQTQPVPKDPKQEQIISNWKIPTTLQLIEPLPEPKTARYVLKIALVQGFDLPVDSTDVAIRVSWGLPKSSGPNGTPTESTRNLGWGVGTDVWVQTPRSEGTKSKRSALWDKLITIDAEWPADLCVHFA